jgi:hypothetical protein
MAWKTLIFFPLIAPALAASPRDAVFREYTLATDLKGGYQVVAADLTLDGKPDLIALASGMTELVWFENPGWQRHVIARGLNRMINLAAYDTGADAIPELVVASEFNNDARKSLGIVSLLQHQGDPRLLWKVTEIDRLPASHRIRVVNGHFVNAPLTAASAEPPEFRGHTPLVCYNPGEWKRRLISEEDEGVVHGIHVTDFDGDRRQDILTASFLGIHLYRANPSGWERPQRLTAGSRAAWPKSGSSDVAVGKLGRKRFICAVEPWHGNEVAVYFEEKKNWKREVIDDTLVDGHTILAADLNGDGDDEIIAGYRGQGRSVHIYYRAGKAWRKTILDNGGIAAAACEVTDLNGDRRPDIACIGSASSNLKWFENLGPADR